MSALWVLFTTELPQSLRIRRVLLRVGSLMDLMSTASAIGIIAFLVVWLQLLRILIVLKMPSVFVIGVVVFGVGVLVLSEEKYKVANAPQRRQKCILESFVINKASASADPAALPFLKCKENGTKNILQLCLRDPC